MLFVVAGLSGCDYDLGGFVALVGFRVFVGAWHCKFSVV